MEFYNNMEPRMIALQCLTTSQALRAIKMGMRLTRTATPTRMMQWAGKLTGVKYKARAYDQAIADLNALREAANAQELADRFRGLYF